MKQTGHVYEQILQKAKQLNSNQCVDVTSQVPSPRRNCLTERQHIFLNLHQYIWIQSREYHRLSDEQQTNADKMVEELHYHTRIYLFKNTITSTQ